MRRDGHVLCKLISQSHWLFVDPHISLFPSVVSRLSCLEDVQIPFPSPTWVKYLPALGFLHRKPTGILFQRTWCARGCSLVSLFPFLPPVLFLWLHRDFYTAPKYITAAKGKGRMGSWFRMKITKTVRSRNVWPTRCPWPTSGWQQKLPCLGLGRNSWLRQYFKR